MIRASRLLPPLLVLGLFGLTPVAVRAQDRLAGVAPTGSATLAARRGLSGSLEALAVPSSASLAPASAFSGTASGGLAAASSGQGSLEDESAAPANSPAKTGARAPRRRTTTGRLVLVERGATEALTLARLTESAALLRAGKSPATTQDAARLQDGRLEVFVVTRWRERAPLFLRLAPDSARSADRLRLAHAPGATVSLSGVVDSNQEGRVVTLTDWKILALSTGERLSETPHVSRKPESAPVKDEDDFKED